MPPETAVRVGIDTLEGQRGARFTEAVTLFPASRIEWDSPVRFMPTKPPGC